MRKIRIKVYTGPTTVIEVGARTAADAVGTEHCYYDFVVGDETTLADAISESLASTLRNLKRAGLTGYAPVVAAVRE
jgi:hypothetical protein